MFVNFLISFYETSRTKSTLVMLLNVSAFETCSHILHDQSDDLCPLHEPYMPHQEWEDMQLTSDCVEEGSAVCCPTVLQPKLHHCSDNLEWVQLSGALSKSVSLLPKMLCAEAWQHWLLYVVDLMDVLLDLAYWSSTIWWLLSCTVQKIVQQNSDQMSFKDFDMNGSWIES